MGSCSKIKLILLQSIKTVQSFCEAINWTLYHYHGKGYFITLVGLHRIQFVSGSDRGDADLWTFGERKVSVMCILKSANVSVQSEDEREMCARTIYCTNIDKKVKWKGTEFCLDTALLVEFNLWIKQQWFDSNHQQQLFFLLNVAIISSVANWKALCLSERWLGCRCRRRM